MVKVTEGVSHALKLVAVGGDVEVALHKILKLGIKIQRTVLTIFVELLLKTKPYVACGGIMIHDDLDELGADGAVNPRDDDAIHAAPVGGVAACLIGEYGRGERVLSEDDEEEAVPLSVVGRGEVEDSWDESPDVLNGYGLRVEVGNRSSLMEKEGVVKVPGVRSDLSRLALGLSGVSLGVGLLSLAGSRFAVTCSGLLALAGGGLILLRARGRPWRGAEAVHQPKGGEEPAIGHDEKR